MILAMTVTLGVVNLLLASDPGVAGACCMFVVGPAVQAIICWHVARGFETLPPKYRLQDPNMAWLLLVPLFNLYWNFKIFPELAESFQAYFYSRGVAEVDDCGENLTRWYCWLAVVGLIPCFIGLPFLAALVFVILFLIKVEELKKRLFVLEQKSNKVTA